MSGPLRITYLSIGGTDISAALADIIRDLKADISLDAFESKATERDPMEHRTMIRSARSSHVFMINIHGDVSRYRRYDDLRKVLVEDKINTFLLCHIEESMVRDRELFLMPDDVYWNVRRYMQLGGPENQRGLLMYLRKVFTEPDLEVPEPKVSLAQGIYHPDMPREITLEEYLKALEPDRPTVGVLINHASWLNGNLEAHDLMIREIERRGANTIPVFCTLTPSDITGSIGGAAVANRYFTENGKPRVGSIVLAAFGFSTLALSSPTDGSARGRNFFRDIGVPIIACVPLFRPQAEWEKDGIGMEGGELAVSVAMPEVDGQLTSVPFSFNERDAEGHEFTTFRKDRIERIAGMAVGWARVRDIPVNERRVSILFNSGAMSDSGLGAAGGLDSFASVQKLLARMKDQGYTIDHVPESSEEIVNNLLSAVTTNLEWVAENEIPERAADMMGAAAYGGWSDALGAVPRECMCRDWGDPPGDIMSLDGKFIIPGVRNGNIYLGMEPERGKHAKAKEMMHDPDISPPHSYLAYYRWVAQVFKTDLHVHVGTHGSAEWLPGKGNALSADCYPDIMMEDMPHLYIYVIDDPSEGIVAKRRKRSVLVDHLMPSLTRAETYGGLAELEGHLQSWLFAKQTRQASKMEAIGDEIVRLVAELSMNKELGLEEGAAREDILSRCELIFDYITGLKDGLITDGLHILGHVPEGRHMAEMVYCLTRLKNGRTPSLRATVAKSMGFDLDTLLDNMSSIDPHTGNINGIIVDRIDVATQELIVSMQEAGYERARCMEIAEGRFGIGSDVMVVVDFICSVLCPNILGIRDEMENMIIGMDGGYIPPGPSGSPTRGNAHLLPTGRNYYSLDPEAVPEEASWKVGVRMADDMIARYVSKEGKYPESVGIVVWSIDTMKTGGDDMAYILWLMGVRPTWGSVGGKITGLDVIPVKELGRPRIDVTVRISSLFRDTFPNLFQLLDEAVELVAGLDESEEDNYIRKHLREDVAGMIKDGMIPAEAKELSMMRIFGEPPRTHGAGVDILVESSKWTTVEDLAQMYITCGCSAYGRKWRGDKRPEMFRHRLIALDVAVKNQADREFDLIDVDDGYAYLGGMNAVVRAAGKERPINYIGDSSDPDRIKTRDLEEEMAYMIRTRVLNPKWIEGLKDHGFAGAGLVASNINHAFGWDATSEVVEDWMYHALAEHFLFDEDNRRWIEVSNPYALKEMLEDLLEANEREMWDAGEETVKRLKELYLEADGVLEETASKR